MAAEGRDARAARRAVEEGEIDYTVGKQLVMQDAAPTDKGRCVSEYIYVSSRWRAGREFARIAPFLEEVEEEDTDAAMEYVLGDPSEYTRYRCKLSRRAGGVHDCLMLAEAICIGEPNKAQDETKQLDGHRQFGEAELQAPELCLKNTHTMISTEESEEDNGFLGDRLDAALVERAAAAGPRATPKAGEAYFAHTLRAPVMAMKGDGTVADYDSPYHAAAVIYTGPDKTVTLEQDAAEEWERPRFCMYDEAAGGFETHVNDGVDTFAVVTLAVDPSCQPPPPALVAKATREGAAAKKRDWGTGATLGKRRKKSHGGRVINGGRVNKQKTYKGNKAGKSRRPAKSRSVKSRSTKSRKTKRKRRAKK